MSAAIQLETPAIETSNISISAHSLSKIYRIYDQPQDRLKQMLLRGRRMYGREFWALRNVSFDVRRGEKLGIIGRNGSGKSTLLQIIAGTLTPSAGAVQVNGRVAALLELGSGFNPEFTGRENVFMNGSILGMSQRTIEERFEEIASFADIGNFIDQPVKLYSSGMFMRLAFAVTTSMDPNILLIDEALAVGDVFFRQKCYRRLEELCDRGVSIVLVSHAMTDIEQFCQRTIVLDRGNVLFEGPSSEAVKLYYLLEQQDHVRQTTRVKSKHTTGDLFPTNEQHYVWPAPTAFSNVASLTQVSNGWARCTALALCDTSNQPCAAFQQGDTARFFYEFELLQDIEVPIGGVEIRNDKGILVHGKNTLQYDSAVPRTLASGSRIRFRHDISLELDLGEYTFAVGLATVSQYDYERRRDYTQLDLFEQTIRLCHLPDAGQLSITFEMTDTPGQLMHYGIANIPGECRVSIVAPEAAPSQPLDRSATPPSPSMESSGPAATMRSVQTSDAMPTIFHITHWKAGSQWINRILHECTPDRVIEPQVNEIQFLYWPLHSGKVYPTVYVTKQQFESVRLPQNWRRFIVIRDLRDTLISAYFSLKATHKIVDAAQANERAHLHQLDMENGLIYLMDGWLTGCARIQTSWIEAGVQFYRYEDLLTNDIAILEHVLLDECKLPVSRERLHEVVIGSRFEKLTSGRPRGQEDITAHERKGIAGDWRNYFTDRVKQAFKTRYGGLLIASGYEQDFSW